MIRGPELRLETRGVPGPWVGPRGAQTHELVEICRLRDEICSAARVLHTQQREMVPQASISAVDVWLRRLFSALCEEIAVKDPFLRAIADADAGWWARPGA